MSKKYSILVWAAFYLVMVHYIYSEYVKLHNPEEETYLFLEQSLFRLQKFLYNTSIFFTIYLFIMKLPFTSPMFVSRCKEAYTKHILMYGLKICSIYVLFTLLIHLGIPMLFGTYIPITGEIILNTARLLSFVLSMYFLYLYLYLKTNKQILSMLSIYVINLTILVIYYSVSFALGINSTIEMELRILTILSSVINIVGLLAIINISRNRDFI
ncbi:hypothetical protein [Fictibacillus sp. BK138]|uniref:hypothetical protein n=1 Tax=Fictibacillus sp. BK138 TaxID=2512121 RepID=UPI00102A0DDB|nr:hypothetical protein [Fictibacillus sp. BK138]RZT21386.1 hypothetical protein EV282_0448 [Fictibacillus sp. BK138]